MRRAYKFRAYPTRPQEARATRLLADHCDLYNAALEERREAWRMRQTSITYGTQSAQLKEIRRYDRDGQGRHSFTAQQQTLRRLSSVFEAFYQRSREDGAGYPRFKPYSRFDQVMFVAGDGAKWSPSGGDGWARVSFQAVGAVKVRLHRHTCMRDSSACGAAVTFVLSQPLLGRRVFGGPARRLLGCPAGRGAQVPAYLAGHHGHLGGRAADRRVTRLVMAWMPPMSFVPGLGDALWPVTFVILQVITNVYLARSGFWLILRGQSGQQPSLAVTPRLPARTRR